MSVIGGFQLSYGFSYDWEFDVATVALKVYRERFCTRSIFLNEELTNDISTIDNRCFVVK